MGNGYRNIHVHDMVCVCGEKAMSRNGSIWWPDP